MPRYLKITDGLVFATDNLTKDDLGRARTGSYCAIVDLKSPQHSGGAVYNPEYNRWDAIKNV